MPLERIKPTHDLTSDAPDWSVEAISFAADGRLYAEVRDSSINLWDLVVFYWPEILGAAAALAALVLVVALVRVSRRPQVRGGTYCRNCNYSLVDLKEDACCPECATDPAVSPPQRGRSRMRRLAIPLVVGIVATCGYGSLHLLKVRRFNGASNWFHWSSARVDRYAVAKDAKWLLKHKLGGRRIVEINPNTGAITRTVHRIGTFTAFRFDIAPDGRTAIVTMNDGGVAAIDLHDGSIRARLARRDAGISPASKFGGASWRHVAGWLDGDRVYVQYVNLDTQEHDLFLWSIGDGEAKHVCKLPPADMSDGFPRNRLLYLLQTGAPTLALERGSDSDAKGQALIRDLTDAGRVVGELKGTFWTEAAPVVMPGERAFFIRGGSGTGIVQWSFAELVQLGSLREPGFMGTLQDGPAGLAYHAPTRRLFVAATGPEAVHVRDIDAKEWIARLEFGIYALPDDWVAISPDGRWVAIRVTEVYRTTGQFKSHAMIFDIGKLTVQRPKAGD